MSMKQIVLCTIQLLIYDINYFTGIGRKESKRKGEEGRKSLGDVARSPSMYA
jgi:hypothetical protein